MAGGEFDEIRQYASARGWDLSDRQLRRYQERAYKRLAATTRRDQEQLLGRHLMQRRALYARSLKTNDIRTALQVLRDEASLEGLYPPTKIAPTTPDGRYPYQGPTGPLLTREERFLRLLAAEDRKDEGELRLLQQSTPHVCYRLPDTMMPQQMLNTCALIYVAEQLDHAGMVFVALWEEVTGRDKSGSWNLIGQCHAYRFKVGVDAWEQFTSSLGVDLQRLIQANHRGSLLELLGDRVYELAPTEAEITRTLEESGQSFDHFLTPQEMAREWQNLLSKVLGK
ncbi:MAG: hypothetical protein ACC652_08625 [Acidimicrobiales bacterium]